MMRRASTIPALLLSALLTGTSPAAADQAPAADAPSATAPADGAAEEMVVIRIRGRAFVPSEARVRAGRKTRLVFRNQDAELHAFVPGNLFNGVNLNVGGNGAPEFGDHGFRKVIIPGEGVAELRFVLQQPGRYPYICDMPGHEMRATLVVE